VVHRARVVVPPVLDVAEAVVRVPQAAAVAGLVEEPDGRGAVPRSQVVLAEVRVLPAQRVQAQALPGGVTGGQVQPHRPAGMADGGPALALPPEEPGQRAVRVGQAEQVAHLVVAVDGLPEMAAGDVRVAEPHRGPGPAAVQAGLRAPVVAPHGDRQRPAGDGGPVVPVTAPVEQLGQGTRQFHEAVVHRAVPHRREDRGPFRFVPPLRLVGRTQANHR
jgi:hypothetical protein